MSPGRAMTDGRGPTPEQKRRAIASAIVLALLAAGIYVTAMLKMIG